MSLQAESVKEQTFIRFIALTQVDVAIIIVAPEINGVHVIIGRRHCCAGARSLPYAGVIIRLTPSYPPIG